MTVEKDNAPSTSQFRFSSIESGNGVWMLEVRSRDYGVGTVRLGELVLHGSLDGTLTCSIDRVLYGSDNDDSYGI